MFDVQAAQKAQDLGQELRANHEVSNKIWERSLSAQDTLSRIEDLSKSILDISQASMQSLASLNNPLSRTTSRFVVDWNDEEHYAREDANALVNTSWDSSLLAEWTDDNDRINRWILHTLGANPDHSALQELRRQDQRVPVPRGKLWSRLTWKYWFLDEAAVGFEALRYALESAAEGGDGAEDLVSIKGAVDSLRSRSPPSSSLTSLPLAESSARLRPTKSFRAGTSSTARWNGAAVRLDTLYSHSSRSDSTLAAHDVKLTLRDELERLQGQRRPTQFILGGSSSGASSEAGGEVQVF